jgi:hypothetical protein
VSITITPQVLEAVAQYLYDEGYDPVDAGLAAKALREVWEETDHTIEHGDAVIVTKGDMAGQVGHAVIYGYGINADIRVRLVGYQQSFVVPEGGLQRVIT